MTEKQKQKMRDTWRKKLIGKKIPCIIEQITPKEGRSFCDEIVDISFKVAHALVEKMKEERK